MINWIFFSLAFLSSVRVSNISTVRGQISCFSVCVYSVDHNASPNFEMLRLGILIFLKKTFFLIHNFLHVVVQ